MSAVLVIVFPSASYGAGPSMEQAHAAASWSGPGANSRVPHGAPANWAPSPEARASAQSVPTSANWSGFVATATTFTGVSASWFVPAVQPSQSAADSATWIGMDGVSPADPGLIQTGTDQQTSGGQTAYFAWYEVVPAPPVEIGVVAPGDVMNAAIAEVSAGSWDISIQDATSGQSFSTIVAYSGPGTSAEWIEEAPTVSGQIESLADFGAVRFGNLGLSGPNESAAVFFPLYMVDPATQNVIAYPNNLDAATHSLWITWGSPPSPVVTSVSPSSGPTGGGTSVTISGFSLLGTTGVAFGGTPAASVAIVSDNEIVATSPNASAGTVDIVVTTVGGTSATSGADAFTFVGSSAVMSGYDLVGSDGGVFVFPSTGGFYGSLPGLGVSVHDVVGMVPSPDHGGYFLVGSDGGVFAFGDAPYEGSLPGLGITVDDVRGIVPTSDDQGYFLVGSDGGVFAFGDAPYLGSLPGMGIHVGDVIGIAATPSGQGYWVVAADGSVYGFGDASALGSVAGSSSPVSGIAATPDGGGYWIVTRDGSVYPFGDAGQFGSLPSIGVAPAMPVIGLVPTADDLGYWLIGSDGGIFAFGDAPYVGSLPDLGVHVSDVVGAVPTLG